MCSADEHTNQAVTTLPGLKEIFEALRQGRHLCRADGQLYQQLEDHRKAFVNLFDQLGFELKKHRRDFYYFYAPNIMTEKSQRIALFMFILIQWITDQGQPIEEALMNQQFNYDELPHFKNARYQEMLAQLNVVDTDGLATIVTNMARMGFADRINDQIFAFRTPVYRFLDICQDIARSQKQDEPVMEEPDE